MTMHERLSVKCFHGFNVPDFFAGFSVQAGDITHTCCDVYQVIHNGWSRSGPRKCFNPLFADSSFPDKVTFERECKQPGLLINLSGDKDLFICDYRSAVAITKIGEFKGLFWPVFRPLFQQVFLVIDSFSSFASPLI